MESAILVMQNVVKDNQEIYIKFSLLDSGEIQCNYEAKDVDLFLRMLTMIMSGEIAFDVIEKIFSDIDDEELKHEFLRNLYNSCNDQLEAKNEEVVIKPSQFRI